MLWGPWIGDWFKGVRPSHMHEFSISQLVAMVDYVEKMNETE